MKQTEVTDVWMKGMMILKNHLPMYFLLCDPIAKKMYLTLSSKFWINQSVNEHD